MLLEIIGFFADLLFSENKTYQNVVNKVSDAAERKEKEERQSERCVSYAQQNMTDKSNQELKEIYDNSNDKYRRMAAAKEYQSRKSQQQQKYTAKK